MCPAYQKRTYRNLVKQNHLTSFSVIVRETDLLLHAAKPFEDIARELVLEHRGVIESYIRQYPAIATTLTPWVIRGPGPRIIRDMADAGEKVGVGPMAAIAGAVAEYVGAGLLQQTDEVIVENGGDIFLKTNTPTIIGIYAGRSPLNMRVGLRLKSDLHPTAVCTSSGTIGHSLSLGKADAVCVVSASCCLADAAATAIGNRVRSKKEIQPAMEFGKKIAGVQGLVIIVGDEMGIWGGLEVVPLHLKKG